MVEENVGKKLRGGNGRGLGGMEGVARVAKLAGMARAVGWLLIWRTD